MGPDREPEGDHAPSTIIRLRSVIVVGAVASSSVTSTIGSMVVYALRVIVSRPANIGKRKAGAGLTAIAFHLKPGKPAIVRQRAAQARHKLPFGGTMLRTRRGLPRGLHRQRASGPSDGAAALACNRNLPLTLRLERGASVRPIGGLLGPGTVPFDQSAGRDRAPLWHGDERVTCS